MKTQKLFNISGNVALVTGGNGGIGRGIAIKVSDISNNINRVDIRAFTKVLVFASVLLSNISAEKCRNPGACHPGKIKYTPGGIFRFDIQGIFA